MSLPLLALDLLLSVMADSKEAIHALLADEFLSGNFTVGIINALESIERRLAATFSGNLPMADSDLVVAKVEVLGVADVVTSTYVSSQRAYSLKQRGPVRIDGYSVALFVAIPNAAASSRRTDFDGPNPIIQTPQDVFGKPIVTFPEANAELT